MDIFGIKIDVGMVQKSVLLRTAKILGKVLEIYGESINNNNKNNNDNNNNTSKKITKIVIR